MVAQHDVIVIHERNRMYECNTAFLAVCVGLVTHHTCCRLWQWFVWCEHEVGMWLYGYLVRSWSWFMKLRILSKKWNPPLTFPWFLFAPSSNALFGDEGGANDGAPHWQKRSKALPCHRRVAVTRAIDSKRTFLPRAFWSFGNLCQCDFGVSKSPRLDYKKYWHLRDLQSREPCVVEAWCEILPLPRRVIDDIAIPRIRGSRLLQCKLHIHDFRFSYVSKLSLCLVSSSRT